MGDDNDVVFSGYCGVCKELNYVDVFFYFLRVFRVLTEGVIDIGNVFVRGERLWFRFLSGEDVGGERELGEVII